MARGPVGLRASAVGFLAASLASAALAWLLARAAPPFTRSESDAVKDFVTSAATLSMSVETLKKAADVLQQYAGTNQAYVVACFCLLQAFVQVFALPVNVVCSVLAGAVFGFKRGYPVAAVTSTLGACCCYGTSYVCGKPLVRWLWPEKMRAFEDKVRSKREHMLMFVLTMRLMPVFPITFINFVSPLAGVPFPAFALGTLLGCLPLNLVLVQVGCNLKEVTSLGELTDPRFVAASTALGALVAIGLIYKVKAKAKKNE